jgi:hypothetical protein
MCHKCFTLSVEASQSRRLVDGLLADLSEAHLGAEVLLDKLNKTDSCDAESTELILIKQQLASSLAHLGGLLHTARSQVLRSTRAGECCSSP